MGAVPRPKLAFQESPDLPARRREATLVLRYGKIVESVIARRLAGHALGADRQDAIQEALLSILLLERSRHEELNPALACTIARCKAADVHRKRYRQRKQEGEGRTAAPEEVAAPATSVTQERGVREFVKQWFARKIGPRRRFSPAERAFMSAISQAKGRRAIRNHPKVAALGLTRDEADRRIAAVRKLVDKDRDRHYLRCMYRLWRSPHPQHGDGQKNPQFRGLGEWNYKRLRTRFNRWMAECEAAMREEFLG